MMVRRRAESYITQRNFALAVAGVILAAIVGFYAYEFKFLRPPELEVLDPPKDLLTGAALYDVRGRTDPDADVTLNGRPLFSGGTGEFVERIYLFGGVNRITLEAKNRYGKTTTITRYLVVR